MKALIIGGGIGGATAAVALRQAGLEVALYERAPEPREVGAGIGLWGNAVGALRRIGLADAVIARGEVMRLADFKLADGRLLSRMGGAEFAAGSAEPLTLVHRAELLEELLRPLPHDIAHFGRMFTHSEERGRKIVAHFQDGGSDEGDILIGADGLHSRVRAEIRGEEQPRYSGYTCWRAVVSVPPDVVPPGFVAEVWGKGARFGITRIGGGRVYWWAALNTPESPMAQGAIDEAARALLLKSHGGFCEPVPTLIRMTDADRIVRNDIYDRPPIRRWWKGRALMIGDAAHPTTPNYGMGGCMAIEDGVVLGLMLAHTRGGARSVEELFSGFVAHRHSKTARTVRESRLFGIIGQWKNPVLCWGRNRVMRFAAGAGARHASRRFGRFEAP